MKQTCTIITKLMFLFVLLYAIAGVMLVEAHKCKSGVKLRGKEGDCHTGGHTAGSVIKNAKAILTVNGFEKGGDGGGPSECDGHFHSDDTLIVALSTRWFNHMKRCNHFITIHGNGRSVRAKVVDECDERRGCKSNIVDGSKAIWKALGVKKNDKRFGEMDITWSDA